MGEVKLRHLTLVHNESEGCCKGAKPLEDPRRQLELFSEGPGTVVYASPEHCELHALILVLKSAHIRQIFDLRDVPYLAFNGETREKFLDALSRLNVGYSSSLALATKPRADSDVNLSQEIKKYLASGATMVFSDLEPERDPDVAKIDEDLSRITQTYRAVFLSLHET